MAEQATPRGSILGREAVDHQDGAVPMHRDILDPEELAARERRLRDHLQTVELLLHTTASDPEQRPIDQLTEPKFQELLTGLLGVGLTTSGRFTLEEETAIVRRVTRGRQADPSLMERVITQSPITAALMSAEVDLGLVGPVVQPAVPETDHLAPLPTRQELFGSIALGDLELGGQSEYRA